MLSPFSCVGKKLELMLAGLIDGFTGACKAKQMEIQKRHYMWRSHPPPLIFSTGHLQKLQTMLLRRPQRYQQEQQQLSMLSCLRHQGQ
jgi:hypothetical protein